MSMFKVEGTFVCLFSSLGIFNRFSSFLAKNVLILKGLSLRERKFDLSDSFSLGRDSSSL